MAEMEVVASQAPEQNYMANGNPSATHMTAHSDAHYTGTNDSNHLYKHIAASSLLTRLPWPTIAYTQLPSPSPPHITPHNLHHHAFLTQRDPDTTPPAASRRSVVHFPQDHLSLMGNVQQNVMRRIEDRSMFQPNTVAHSHFHLHEPPALGMVSINFVVMYWICTYSNKG
jgi:hypothetical protein